jgi:hypothetical protein
MTFTTVVNAFLVDVMIILLCQNNSFELFFTGANPTTLSYNATL